MFGFYRPELLPSESSRRHLSVSPVDSVHKHDQTHDCARASRGLSALLSSYLLCRTASAGVTLLTGMGWARNAGAEGRKVGGGTPS